jgi:uncharacterized GH25 family protein
MTRRTLLTGALSAAALLAAKSETAISISVTGPTGKPVGNAAVILDFLGSHQIVKLGKRKAVHWEVHTDERGLAKFPPIPQGTIQLQVIAKNYQTFGQTFDLDTEEKTIDVKLLRPQSQYSVDGQK